MTNSVLPEGQKQEDRTYDQKEGADDDKRHAAVEDFTVTVDLPMAFLMQFMDLGLIRI